MLVTILLGSDKTTVSVATGQNDYYPLYLSVGNISNRARRAHQDGVVPIGFLAIPKGMSIYLSLPPHSEHRVAERDDEKTTTFREFRWQLFHSSLATILKPIRSAMETPEVVQCPDGHFRRVIYSLGPYIADYPEQVLLSGIVSGWCPKSVNFYQDVYHTHWYLDAPRTPRILMETLPPDQESGPSTCAPHLTQNNYGMNTVSFLMSR